MSFRASVERRSLRSLHKTLSCLSKIGSDLILETNADALLLRALAPTYAAYAHVKLTREFFVLNSFVHESIAPAPSMTAATQSSHFIKCKVHIKHVMLAFRHMSAASKLDIIMSTVQNKLFLIIWVGGVKTTYGVPFEVQSNILQADFPRSSSPNTLVFKPELFHRALESFNTKVAELTLIIDSMTQLEMNDDAKVIRLKNYFANDAHNAAPNLELRNTEAINTEANIPISQLERFDVPSSHDGPIDLTFNAKEVRAFLVYCDALNDMDVLIRWSNTGSPMLFETKPRHLVRSEDRMEYEMSEQEERAPLNMQLVVATLAESQIASQSTSTPMQQAAGHGAASPAPSQIQQGMPSSQPHSSQLLASQQQRIGSQQGLSQGSQHALSQSFHQKQSAAMPIREAEEIPPTP